MAAFALTDCTVWVGGLDITGDSNNVALDASCAELDATNFGSGGAMSRIGGLRDTQFSHQGHASFAEPDSTLWTDLGTANQVITVSPTGADGDVAYTFKSLRSAYQPFGGNVGDVAGFQGTANGSDSQGLIRSTILVPKTTVTGTGNGTGRQLGAVSAAQFLYGTFHVFTSGTTITAVLESDDNSGFTSATTRVTFGPITSIGATWATRVAGAITDDWWRIRYTTVTGTHVVAATCGIAA